MIPMAQDPMIHHTAIVHPSAVIGGGTAVWAFAVIEQGVWIGESCAIGTHTYIGNYATLGNRVRIMGQAYIPTRIRIGNDVFIGPGAVFTGDRYPRVNKPGHIEDPVTIEDDVRVGANVTVLPGVTLGRGCLIGAGSVVTHDVPPYQTWVGNPAHRLYESIQPIAQIHTGVEDPTRTHIDDARYVLCDDEEP